MRLDRPVIAQDPRRFGRRVVALAMVQRSPLQLGDDLRLFLSTFAAGFVVVAMLIA